MNSSDDSACDNETKSETNESWSQSHRDKNRQSYERKKRFTFENSHDSISNSLKSTGDMTHYQRLNIDNDATSDAVKSAYYTLSKLYHPDTADGNTNESTENFRLITEAYDILIDPTSRAHYDQSIKPIEINFGVSHNSPRDFPNFYRPSNTDMIIKLRQAALQREKLKNPRKFRAGSFKTKPMSYDDLEKLNRRLDRLYNDISRGNFNDGDIYKAHLRNSIGRRLSMMRENPQFLNTLRSHQNKESTFIESSPILASLSVVACFISLTVLYFVEFDAPAYLDERLSEFLKNVNRPKIDD